MPAVHIGLVVEGFGDVDAVPNVIYRYLHSVNDYTLQLGKPMNAKGHGNLTKDGGIERLVTAAARLADCAGVLVVLDSEHQGQVSCPAALGPTLLSRAEGQASRGLPVRICLAVTKFENWIAASAPGWQPASGGYEGAGAIQAIEAHFLDGERYGKTAMQGKLASLIDLQLVRQRCPSFDRLLNCVDSLRASG